MECIKCGKKNKSSSKFCRYCGSKLKTENKKEHGSFAKKKIKIPTWAGILVVFIVLGVIIGIGIWTEYGGSSISYNPKTSINNPTSNFRTPTCRDIQVPYTDQEPYTKTEYYTDKEPYTTQECNNIQIPYEATEEKVQNLFYDIDEYISSSDRLAHVFTLSQGITVDISFKADGELNLWVMDYDQYKKVLSGYSTDQYYIKKVDTTSATASFTTPGNNQYVIYLKNENIYKTKQVFEFKSSASWNEQVTKYRTEEVCNTVTKYKDVQKSRQVTDYKSVTKYRTEQRCD